MSQPRQHPIDALIATAEEAARIMWRTYDAHFALPPHSQDWRKKADENFKRCMACNEKLAKLKAERKRILGEREGD